MVEVASPLRTPALDVGTGRGVLAAELARVGLEVVSIDPDPSEQELARLTAAAAAVEDRIRFVPGDAALLPHPTATFGCAAMMDVLHHLDEPDAVLREVARVLVPGGRLVLAEFDEAGFELVSRVFREEGLEHPRTATTLATATVAAERLGFRLVRRAVGHVHEVVVLRREPHR